MQWYHDANKISHNMVLMKREVEAMLRGNATPDVGES